MLGLARAHPDAASIADGMSLTVSLTGSLVSNSMQAERGYGVTSIVAIMPLSSCERMWQW